MSEELEFYSQHGQDKYIFDNFFKDKKNGIYVDIGATNGIGINNTYFFEKNLNWTGVCIEPQSCYSENLAKNRPKSICINGCIADFNGSGLFLEIEGYPKALSGLVNKYDERHLQRIENEIKMFGGSKKEIEVNCFVLNDILKKNEITKVDFCSIDVEGAELDILKTIDFVNIEFDIFTIENNYSDSTIKKFMKEKGFKIVEILACDEIYKKI